MKESQWRTKLVNDFKKYQIRDSFIWAMDAKFKAGFPDLLVIIMGKTIHYELKVIRAHTNKSCFELFDPIQRSVMSSINRAGGDARGLILNECDDEVLMFDFTRHLSAIYNKNVFNNLYWINTHRWPS